GRKEFYWVYLTMVVFGNLVWALECYFLYPGAPYMLIGASGAVSGIVILFVLNNPKATVMLFFVLPVQAWIMGVMFIVLSVWGVGQPSVGLGQTRVAHEVHLAGAAFALGYWYLGWN